MGLHSVKLLLHPTVPELTFQFNFFVNKDIDKDECLVVDFLAPNG